MLKLALFLALALARAEPPPLAGEPLFCTDPVADVCENRSKIKVNYDQLNQKLKEIESSPGAAEKIFALLKDFERTSFIPSFEETRTRFISELRSAPELPQTTRAMLESRISAVAYSSLATAPEALHRMAQLRKNLPKTSIFRKITPEGLETLKTLNFEKMSSQDRTYLQLLLQTLALAIAQRRTCGEGASFNAFSLGDEIGKPMVSVCVSTVVGLQPIETQIRYPLLAYVFAHELGHHLDSRAEPLLFANYRACLAADLTGQPELAKLSDELREITADFWAARTLGNVLRMRASVMAEAPDAERSRALNFVRMAFWPLCGTPEGGGHPSGAFRLNHILSLDPGIRRIVGCKEAPTCTLVGKQGPAPAPSPSALRPISTQ
jgi:hypothetical protein